MAKYDNRSIERALFVLEAVAEAADAISLSDIAERLEMSRATVFRHLKTLEKNGFVMSTPDKRYIPGFMLFRLGRRQLQWETLARMAEPVVKRLAHEANATAHVGALEGNQVYYLRKIQPDVESRFFTRPGMRLDAHATALGKAMLAHTPEPEVLAMYKHHPLHRHTQKTISSIDALMANLRRVRHVGYAIERGESIPGVVCVAAPVINTLGQSTIAISLSAPASQFDDSEVARLGKKLRAAVDEFVTQVVSRPFSLSEIPKQNK